MPPHNPAPPNPLTHTTSPQVTSPPQQQTPARPRARQPRRRKAYLSSRRAARSRRPSCGAQRPRPSRRPSPPYPPRRPRRPRYPWLFTYLNTSRVARRKRRLPAGLRSSCCQVRRRLRRPWSPCRRLRQLRRATEMLLMMTRMSRVEMRMMIRSHHHPRHQSPCHKPHQPAHRQHQPACSHHSQPTCRHHHHPNLCRQCTGWLCHHRPCHRQARGLAACRCTASHRRGRGRREVRRPRG